jgi:hypothetical protein
VGAVTKRMMSGGEGGKATRRTVGGTKPVLSKRNRLAGSAIRPLGRNKPYKWERNLPNQNHGEIFVRLSFQPYKRSNHHPSILDTGLLNQINEKWLT